MKIPALFALTASRKTERGAIKFLTGLVARAAPFGLFLTTSRKTERGAIKFLTGLVARAAPFALFLTTSRKTERGAIKFLTGLVARAAPVALFLTTSRKTERGAIKFLTSLAVRAAPVGLFLTTSRKTKRGAIKFLTSLAVRAAPFALLGALLCAAETRTLTLKQALQIAVQQNPDLMIARLDAQRAHEQIDINKDPFSPKIGAGSGLAWAYGFPSSIDGSAPSIVQVRTTMAIYDKPQSYLVDEAKEAARGAGFGVDQKQADVIFRVASAYIDAENDARALDAAKQEDAELLRVKQLTQARVEEGQELRHEVQKANVAELDAAYRVSTLTSTLAKAERSLATVLGLAPGDRVHAADDQIPALEPPVSQEQAVANALSTSPEIRKLESDLQAKALELKSYKAYRRPTVNLVAQYALLSKFDNYAQYFQRFQYNNTELGASFSIPLLAGKSAKAYITTSEIDADKIRAQIAQVRARIQNDIEDAFDDFRVADEGRKVALEYLNVTRESTTLDLERLSEGQVLQAQVEQDRAEEQQRWRAYYDALATAQHARLNLLRTTGTLQEALK